MPKPKQIKVGNIVLCDLIRKEDSNKDILIGVYGRGIIYNKFPAEAVLTYWIEITPRKLGEDELEFKIEYPGDNARPLIAKVKMETRELEMVPINLPTPLLKITREGPLKLSYRADGGRWRLINTKDIKLRSSLTDSTA